MLNHLKTILQYHSQHKFFFMPLRSTCCCFYIELPPSWDWVIFPTSWAKILPKISRSWTFILSKSTITLQILHSSFFTHTTKLSFRLNDFITYNGTCLTCHSTLWYKCVAIILSINLWVSNIYFTPWHFKKLKCILFFHTKMKPPNQLVDYNVFINT